MTTAMRTSSGNPRFRTVSDGIAQVRGLKRNDRSPVPEYEAVNPLGTPRDVDDKAAFEFGNRPYMFIVDNPSRLRSDPHSSPMRAFPKTEGVKRIKP